MAKNLNWLLNLNLIYKTLWTGAKSGFLISMLGKLNWGKLIFLEENSSFKMLGLTFSHKLDWGSYIISIAKTAPKKFGALIYSMKFLSPEVALYLHTSPNLPYTHVWNIVVTSGLVPLVATCNC